MCPLPNRPDAIDPVCAGNIGKEVATQITSCVTRTLQNDPPPEAQYWGIAREDYVWSVDAKLSGVYFGVQFSTGNAYIPFSSLVIRVDSPLSSKLFIDDATVVVANPQNPSNDPIRPPLIERLRNARRLGLKVEDETSYRICRREDISEGALTPPVHLTSTYVFRHLPLDDFSLRTVSYTHLDVYKRQRIEDS